jgi:uncharacterized membrane protein
MKLDEDVITCRNGKMVNYSDCHSSPHHVILLFAQFHCVQYSVSLVLLLALGYVIFAYDISIDYNIAGQKVRIMVYNPRYIELASNALI